jgi:hypothetical protein
MRLAGALIIAALAAPVAAGAQAAPPADTVSSQEAVPQRDIMDVLRALTGRRVESEATLEPRPGLSLTILPSVGYNPAYGAFIGVSAAFAGWLGDPATTTTSSGSAGVSYSTTQQVSVQFKSDFFTPGNELVFKGDWRYLDTSQDTYGLGSAEPGQSAYPMDFVMYRFYETVYRGVPETPFYVGLGYHFSNYQGIVDARADQGEPTPYTAYHPGYPHHTRASGISANVLYETRDNTINATRGLYWNASIRGYPEALGSDSNWQGLLSDLRVYPHVPRDGRNVLALWNYMWFTFGHAPYLDLPAIGWDTYGRGGRGYIQGRIRGRNQIYNEAEYRVRLTRDGLWGMVGFVSLMSTTGAAGSAFENVDPGGGVGLRVKFNKRSATNLTVDLSWGESQPGRFFFGMQEVF